MALVHRRPVESSVLAEVGYDQKRRVLEVKLVSGAIYQYLDVPAREFMALLAAPSSGRYYNTNIKPNYEYRQL
jgi:KTSC domain-containing protein